MSGEGEAFDPRKHVRQLRGRGGSADYLDVKWRLAWFRAEWPAGTIETEHFVLTDKTAVFRATVRKTSPDGTLHGLATGYGSETAGDFGDFIEKAETKAIGRALNALGYGVQFMEDDAAPDSAPAPRPAQQPPAMPPNVRTLPAAAQAAAGQAGATIDPAEAATIAWKERIESALATGVKGEWEALLADAGREAWRWRLLILAAPNERWVNRLGEEAATRQAFSAAVQDAITTRLAALEDAKRQAARP